MEEAVGTKLIIDPGLSMDCAELDINLSYHLVVILILPHC